MTHRMVSMLMCMLMCMFILVGCTADRSEDSTDGSIGDNSLETLPDMMPEDFNFIYQFGVGGKNEINTFEGTYTKDLILDGSITTELILSQQEMESIYEKMKEVDILNSPSIMRQNEDSHHCGSEPYASDMLEIHSNGQNHFVFWTTNYCLTDELLALIDFSKFVFHDIIERREEYLALPEFRGGYQ